MEKKYFFPMKNNFFKWQKQTSTVFTSNAKCFYGEKSSDFCFKSIL